MKNIYKVGLFVGILIALAVGVLFSNRQYAKQISYLSGDEPHYIMMTDSFVKDGEFNLWNDYKLNRSTSYSDIPGLRPHVSPLVDENSNEWYSIHTVGLPILISIPYKMFGVIGARIWAIALQLAGLALFALVLKKYTKNRMQMNIGVLLMLTCALVWQNIGALFPDLLIITFCSSLILLFGRKDKLSNLSMMAIVVLSGLVHTKSLVLLSPILIAQTLWLLKKYGINGYVKKYIYTILVAVLSVIIYVIYLHKHYGVFSPTELYGSNGQLFGANPITNTIAIITDRSKGILLYAPFIAISGPYLYRAGREIIKFYKRYHKKKSRLSLENYLVISLLVGLGGLLTTQIGFLDWSGSTSPNGRYMLPFVFGVIFLIARYTNIKNRLEITVIGIMAFIGAILSFLSITDFKYYMSTGVDSFWIDRYPALKHLPLFRLTSSEMGRIPSTQGIKIILLLLMFNIGLTILYKYKIILIKRLNEEV